MNGSLTLGTVPDFSKDPRRRKKALQALDLCYEIDLAPGGKKGYTASELRKILGNASSKNTDLAAYLHTLIRQIGFYSKSGITYEYQTVPHRVMRLERILGVERGFLTFAEATGRTFRTCPPRSSYRITGDRHYNWWTNTRKEVRQKLFLATHGVLYDYDLEAAKPTVILQAWRRWMAQHHPMDIRLFDKCQVPTWSELVYNRRAFREALAHQVGISTSEAKAVCQTVLNSATASPHPENGICQLIGTDATKRLMENDLYRGLQADFKTVWSYFKKLAEPGQTAGEFMSAIYNRHERRVMDAIDEVLREAQVDAWYVHDGFMCTRKVDVTSLESEIKARTGMTLKLEEQIFEAEREISVMEEMVE